MLLKKLRFSLIMLVSKRRGEKRDDSIGDYHRSLCPEMAGLLCPGPFAGVHPGQKRTDPIRRGDEVSCCIRAEEGSAHQRTVKAR